MATTDTEIHIAVSRLLQSARPNILYMSLDKEASKLRIDLNRLETSSAEQKSILKNELLVMKDMLIQMNRQLNEKGIIDSRR